MDRNSQEQLDLFSQDQKRPTIGEKKIVITFDRIILIGIINILLFVLIYSLGKEAAKKELALSAYRKTAQPSRISPVSLLSAKKPAFTKTKVKRPAKKKETISSIANKEISDKIRNTISKNKAGTLYVIQVATYERKDIAQERKEELVKEGFPAQLKELDKYTIIIVGSFSDKNRAQRILKSLKKKQYKDCYIKRISL